MKRPLALIIRDGWGHNPHPQWNHANAVYLARKPVGDSLSRAYPTTLIATSGFDVGLPEATMGNSEVGHQNLGAGRIVDQESVRITKQIRSGEFFENPVLVAAIDHARVSGSSLHLMGIVSDAGVHGLLEHLFACLQLAARRGLTRVLVHAFTDGRDCSPRSGIGYIGQLEERMKALGVGRIASVSGRYWSMDRDNRWPRIERAYRAIVEGVGSFFTDAREAVEHYYGHPSEANLDGDEFISPSVIVDHQSREPIGRVVDGDSILFFNYRGDRPRQLTHAFVSPDFTGFSRAKPAVRFTTLTAYEESLPVHVAYPKPPKMRNILGQVISERGLRQLRCAETEKFAHVTFFFNDYREEPFEGEDRILCPSRKDVATYDLVPEMSAVEIAHACVNAIARREHDLLVINFANGDMVGHTGNLNAAVHAIECVDTQVGRIIDALRAVQGRAVVTADHGNAEQMIDPSTGGPHTAHTIYPVEFILMDDRHLTTSLRADGRLADVAPTVLELLGIEKPVEMTGESLIRD
jgi:2,3-bisphosphoglycerate-independent phosphoglycerate mutase